MSGPSEADVGVVKKTLLFFSFVQFCFLSFWLSTKIYITILWSREIDNNEDNDDGCDEDYDGYNRKKIILLSLGS